MSVGSQIKIARKKLGFSQEKLAEILKVDRYKVVNAERDSNKTAQKLIIDGLIKNYNFTQAHFDPDSDINKDVKDKLIEQYEIRIAEYEKMGAYSAVVNKIGEVREQMSRYGGVEPEDEAAFRREVRERLRKIEEKIAAMLKRMEEDKDE